MNKPFLPVLILTLSFLFLFTSCGRKPAAPAVPAVPATASSFVMPNLASEFPGEIRTADYAGKVQLVIFLRSDDPACRGSLRDWSALQDEFATRGFTLVGAIVDDRTRAVIAAEVAACEISWPVGLADASIVAAFGGPAAIRAIPTAFLLRRDGLIARVYPGFVSLPSLRTDIGQLLDGQPLAGITAGTAP
jgi:peroxiredoxin